MARESGVESRTAQGTGAPGSGQASPVLLALVLVVWGALALKRQDVSRFFYSALPPAYLLAAERSAAVWRWLRRRVAARSDRAARWLGRGAAALGLAYLLAALAVRVRTFPLLMAVTYETGPELTQAARWVADQTQPDESAVLLVNGWDQFSAQMLEWAIGAARWPAANPTPVQVLEETLRDPAECQACAGQFAEVALQQPGMRLVHFENAPVPAAGAWWAYAGALAPVWDGQWQTSADFELRLWDGLLQERILARTALGRTGTVEEIAATALWLLRDAAYTTGSVVAVDGGRAPA